MREPRERLAVLERTIERLDRWGSGRGWRGSDPYEGLNARRLAAAQRWRWGRRALIQFVKRSPLDPRRALGIPAGEEAAALALVLSAYVRLGLAPEALRERIAALRLRLEALRCRSYAEPCWGYGFDVQTRFFFYPAGSPNTVATAFVGLALLDACELAGEGSLLELAEGAGEFLLRHVPRTAGSGGAYFGYLPADRTPIHNASMLAAALLAGLGGRTGRRDFADAAASAVGFALAHQRPNGSWPYAEAKGGAWIDGFHTGYVLDSLARCHRATGAAATRAAFERGLAFYARSLFLADGTPKYRPDSVYPIDSQCVAQGIRTFSIASRFDRGWLDRAWRTYFFAVDRMLRPDGAFTFQRRRLWTNPAPHIRWTEAPMLEALAHLAAATRGDGEAR